MTRTNLRRLAIKPQEAERRSIADRNHTAFSADDAPSCRSRTQAGQTALQPGMQPVCRPPQRLVVEVRFWNEMFGWH
jgi:hypothetical protein